MKIYVDSDEYYPFYSLHDTDRIYEGVSMREGVVELSKEEIEEFNKIVQRLDYFHDLIRSKLEE